MPRYREFRLRNRRTEAGLAEVRAEMEADAALRDRQAVRGRQAAPPKPAEPENDDWAALRWEIIQALEDFPEARQAVVAALERGVKRE